MHRVKEQEESISVSLLCVCVRASLKWLSVLYSRDQSFVNQIYVLSTNREKRTEVYPKGTKRFAFFRIFWRTKERLNFFFLVSSRKNKITCTNKKRLAIYFCCDHHRLRICRCFSEEREREREKERMRTTVRGATTRARKRKIGQRDLWDLIVNNDDICFKHILPRLNRELISNSCTRWIVKRESWLRDHLAREIWKRSLILKRCRRFDFGSCLGE